MNKTKVIKGFPREFKWMTDAEARLIMCKIPTPYGSVDGKKLYVLPSSNDLLRIKSMQDSVLEGNSLMPLLKDMAADIFLQAEEEWEQKWEEKYGGNNERN